MIHAFMHVVNWAYLPWAGKKLPARQDLPSKITGRSHLPVLRLTMERGPGPSDQAPTWEHLLLDAEPNAGPNAGDLPIDIQ